METIGLYLKVLNDVRYNVLGHLGCSLSDFSEGSKGYDLVCKVNDAANILSDLITIMKYESDIKK